MGSMGLGTLLLNILFFVVLLAIVIGVVSYFRASRVKGQARSRDTLHRRQ